MSDGTDLLAGAGARALVEKMGEAAASFLASLSPDQRRRALIDFDAQAQRTRWFYTPVEREGLPLSQMEPPQQRLAQRLLASGLSRAGYVTTSTIMGLETTLDALEGWQRPHPGRDSRLYFVSIFGEPHDRQPWGWRFEGHHISLNYTIVDGRIVAPTPTFFGSNPAEAPLGATATLRPLSGVEDLARELLHSLAHSQQAAAILAPKAPPDIVMLNRPAVVDRALPLLDETAMEPWMQEFGFTREELEAIRYSHAPKGLAAAAMDGSQRELLQVLVGEYIRRMPEELAEIEEARLRQQGVETLHFAWAGGVERRQPHYYRIQGDQFLVEYDNTQNDANHIHSVWRDPTNDFGAELLRRHYAHDHR